ASTPRPPSPSGSALSLCTSSSTTCAPAAGFTPGAQNSAAISGGLPGVPTTANARVPRRYAPTSLTAVLSIARGVCWRNIFWLTSEILERSRSVSAEYTPVFVEMGDGASATGGAAAAGCAAAGAGFGLDAPGGHQFAIW